VVKKGIQAAGRFLSWPVVDARAEALGAAIGDGTAAVEVRIADGLDLVIALRALRMVRAAGILDGPGIPPEARKPLRPEKVVTSVSSRSPRISDLLPGQGGCGSPGLWIFSSGTTGRPKPTYWPWPDLARDGNWDLRGPQRWGIGYAPHTYAGVISTCQALSGAGRIDFLRPADLADASMGDAAFDVLAATPSFWRAAAVAVWRGQAGAPAVDTATMGGEPIDEAVVGMVRSTFQPRRINQVYATTELGVLFAFDDGLPGLPVAAAGRRTRFGAAFEVRGDTLLVSPHPRAPFAETGDVVAVLDDRVRFLGRRGNVLNVGGVKVDAARIARVLESHPDVLAARVIPLRSPVLGTVAGAEIMAYPWCDPERVAREVKAHARAHLAGEERPMRITVVQNLPIAPSGKLSSDG
jgi:acyl-coenzyme A synthetase/AMP-(fatty) acid ligase